MRSPASSPWPQRACSSRHDPAPRMTPTRAQVLHGRRCMALRIAVVFGIVLAVTVRDDPLVLAVVVAATLVAVVALLLGCRGSKLGTGSRGSS